MNVLTEPAESVVSDASDVQEVLTQQENVVTNPFNQTKELALLTKNQVIKFSTVTKYDAGDEYEAVLLVELENLPANIQIG